MPEAEECTYRILLADWPVHADRIADVRRRVFIEEQGVPESMEWEAQDPQCDWLLAISHGEVIGIARLTPQATVGRMAVLPEWRRQGVGSALLRAAIGRARFRGYPVLGLHAQTHAIPFYARHGFVPEGEVFLEAGIPHRRMTLRLD